jgi:cytochrome d ubiquinol oxidase subunit I
VYGLMKIEDAGSPAVMGWMALVTLIGFTLVYAVLMVADVYLLVKFAKASPQNEALDIDLPVVPAGATD